MSPLLRATGRKVHVQLDYYLSAQFAGVAAALNNGHYRNRSIDVEFLPVCPPGLEAERVIETQREFDARKSGGICVGTCEQYVLTPQMHQEKMEVTAVAAMFGASMFDVFAIKTTFPCPYIRLMQFPGHLTYFFLPILTGRSPIALASLSAHADVRQRLMRGRYEEKPNMASSESLPELYNCFVPAMPEHRAKTFFEWAPILTHCRYCARCSAVATTEWKWCLSTAEGNLRC